MKRGVGLTFKQSLTFLIVSRGQMVVFLHFAAVTSLTVAFGPSESGLAGARAM